MLPGVFSFYAGNKTGTRHFRRENGKCLLEFHILFFVLGSFLFLFLFLFALCPLIFQKLPDRVLRFWLFVSFGLFRREDFADPEANIFQQLQLLFDGSKLSGKLGVRCLQPVIFRLQGIQIYIPIDALLFRSRNALLKDTMTWNPLSLPIKTGTKTFRLCIRYQVIRPCARFDAGWVGLQPLIIGNVKGASKRAL